MACNPSYSGGRNQEDYGLKPAQRNNSQNPISKIAKTKEAGGVAQVIDDLSSKCEALSSNLSTVKKIHKKQKRNKQGDVI
jgi:uncharacterized protein YaiL (DUF2058 family)